MIFGQRRRGATPVNLTTNRVRVTAGTIAQPWQLSHVAAYLDGLGPNPGTARVRAVIYDSSDRLIVRGDEVRIVDGAPPAWITLPVGVYAGFGAPAGTYSVGFHVGGPTGCARTYVDDPGPTGSRQATDTYGDGTAAVLPSPSTLTASLPVIGSAFGVWAVPAVDDLRLSRLPWPLTQQIFAAAAVIPGTGIGAAAGWHATAFDPEPGAVAVVRTGGPLAALVGERIRVTRRVPGTPARSVAVYVHDEQTFPQETVLEDVSLSRRAFLALAPWPTDTLNVTVETLA